MKKNYIAPAMEIEIIETQNSTLLIGSVGMGDPIGDGDEVTADVKNNDWDFWGDNEEE